MVEQEEEPIPVLQVAAYTTKQTKWWQKLEEKKEAKRAVKKHCKTDGKLAKMMLKAALIWKDFRPMWK